MHGNRTSDYILILFIMLYYKLRLYFSDNDKMFKENKTIIKLPSAIKIKEQV